MSSSSLFSSRSYGALTSRLVWPTATLLAVTLGFVFTTIVWTSDSANFTAGNRQRMQLTGALEQRLEDLKARLVQFAADPGLLGAGLRTAPADGEALAPAPPHPFDFTDQTRPFEDRWGGWYVSGTTQDMHHLGNVTAPDPGKPFDLPQGHTLASLSGRFDPAHALKPGSDIVALMTLEHQTGFINRLYVLNMRYSDAALDDLVQYMTFANEVPLPGPVAGDSGFTADFAKRGPQDNAGRSLRSFDLKTRLFRYPLSYMVYSTAFDTLKPEIRDKLYRRLYDALKAKGADGVEAIAILAQTKSGLPDTWR